MPDQLSHAEVLGRYVGTFVDELVAAGVENVCLCPGSRSTPLALTFERHPNIKTWMHLDERSCAYFALGMAKASGQPIAILCSSGTAAVNFAPAVVEAFHSHVPLIVLTADRPPELQGLGANQTIDQQNLYGTAVKWFVNMPLPEASDHMLRYVRMVARRSQVIAGREGAPGPVHINFPFREPLIPSGHEPQARLEYQLSEEERAENKRIADEIASGRRSVRDEVTAIRSGQDPETDALPPSRKGSFAWEFELARRPIIVCGPDSNVDSPQLMRLTSRFPVPVLADALSGLRWQHTFTTPSVLSLYDSYLRDPSLCQALKPDFILRFGAQPTSKPLQTFLQRNIDVPQFVFTQPGLWPDPDLTARGIRHEERDPGSVVSDLLAVRRRKDSEGWLAAWLAAESRARRTVERLLDEEGSLNEISAVTDLAAVNDTHSVVAGNSMPVRDIDAFYPASDQRVAYVYANRGTSGIDGVVSTALGATARAHGMIVLVIGDLSFYHDMNGLLAAQRFGLRATIVLINNDGGGIFSFLPQHDDAEHFETLWGTPHGIDFSHVAGLYGVGFQRVTTREEYKAALKASFWADGVQIIEIKTDREENLRLHQRIWDAVAEAVRDIAVSSPGGEG
ncbi:MAG TPA: 2-succinyl-5-enolpyruvyl-6-hydroxy-3-cyclohexene-1-carboxylic-acid synthase [Dehalococcoidia bacterium]|nr:2-succinyl-5-enolpyruvyl-6-hydroxy-3-cyclohexene-1-carboxylic-acid synthase [Dehalococcoidia bacterium]